MTGLLSVSSMIFEGAVDGERDVVVLADGVAEFFEEENVRHAGVSTGVDGDCAPLKGFEQLDV